MKVRRYDTARLDGAEITPEGYLKARALATRSGIFNYLKPDGSVRRELRHPEDVFDSNSMRSLAGKCVTDEHPYEPLDANNTAKYSRGWTGDQVRRNGDNVEVHVTITDAALIQQIVKGEKEQVSCGYFCDMDETPGEWQGERYDARQRNISYNHLASVPLGRAGPENKVRMDAADAFMVDAEKKNDGGTSAVVLDPNEDKTKKQKENPMAKIKIDGVEYEVADGLAPVIMAKIDALAKANDAVTAKSKEIEGLQGKFDASDAELKKAVTRADEAEKASKISDKEILSRADSLNKVREFGKKTLDKDFKDDMDVAAVKKAVVAKLMPDVKLDSKSEAYIDAAFDVLASKEASAGSDRLKADLSNKVVGSGSADTVEQAYAKQRADAQNAWKKPSGSETVQ